MSTVTGNKNFLAPSGFKMIIDRKNFGNLEYTVQVATHGSVSLDTSEVAYARTSIKEPGDMLNYGDVTFEMILEEDLDNYKEIHQWLRRMVEEKPRSVTDASAGTAIPNELDITLMVLSSHNNPTNKIIYRDAFPIDLGVISFDSAVDGVTYVTVPVTFAYSYFDIV
jgi:hypothetical protein